MNMLGHNKGPAFDRQTSWRKHCWSRARKELLGAKVPLEIVRIRVKRAEALGLSYPQYASVLMGGGRDITGFLFTVNGLQLTLSRRLALPGYVSDKLSGLEDCALVALAPGAEDPALFAADLSHASGVAFTSTSGEPSAQSGWSAKRDAIRAALGPLKLPPKSVVMIGDDRLERDWSVAGKLAKFLPHSEYFSASTTERTGH